METSNSNINGDTKHTKHIKQKGSAPYMHDKPTAKIEIDQIYSYEICNM